MSSKHFLFTLALISMTVTLAGCGSDPQATFTPDPTIRATNGFGGSRGGRDTRGSGDRPMFSGARQRMGSGMNSGPGRFGSGNMPRFGSGARRGFLLDTGALAQIPGTGQDLVKQLETAQANGDFETVRTLMRQLREEYPDVFPARQGGMNRG